MKVDMPLSKETTLSIYYNNIRIGSEQFQVGDNV